MIRMRKILPKLLPLILFLLIGGKLAGWQLSWWWVFSPVWIPIVIMFISGLCVIIIQNWIDRIRYKQTKQKQDLADASKKNPCKNC